jgi:integrase
MDENEKVPVLYSLLFGEGAEIAQRGASPRLEGWAQAFEAWLEARCRLTPGTLNKARRAWGRLLQQTGKIPWELQAGDIEAHAAWMLGEGCSPSTAYAAQGMVLDFLRWCSQRGVEGEDDAARRAAAGVRRLQVGVYQRAQVLSREELQALLGLMRRATSPIGRRDYAFLLARLRLGVPLGYIQRLKWGQVAPDDSGVWVRWTSEGERRRLPARSGRRSRPRWRRQAGWKACGRSTISSPR